MAASSIQRLLGEVQAWPAGLLDDLPQESWVVIHVKPRQEKMLASNLRCFGLPGILFLEQHVRTYARQGKQSSTVPLLPGYLFTVAPESRYEDIYRTERAVRLMTVRDPTVLRRDLLDLAALVTRSDAPLLVRPELVPGTTVELRAGSLAGLRGVVLRRKGVCELVVNMHMLGTSVALTCSAADVERAEILA